jgi:DNA-binding PadR family transcriptional regulator
MAFKGDLETLVLGVLQAGPMHGYDLSKRLSNLSRNMFRFGEGRLYPALHKLEKDGFIASEWEIQEGRPAKKIYTLTETGQGALTEHKKEWHLFSEGIGAVLNLGEGEVSHGV